jgi:hypothetical protein
MCPRASTIAYFNRRRRSQVFFVDERSIGGVAQMMTRSGYADISVGIELFVSLV